MTSGLKGGYLTMWATGEYEVSYTSVKPEGKDDVRGGVRIKTIYLITKITENNILGGIKIEPFNKILQFCVECLFVLKILIPQFLLDKTILTCMSLRIIII